MQLPARISKLPEQVVRVWAQPNIRTFSSSAIGNLRIARPHLWHSCTISTLESPAPAAVLKALRTTGFLGTRMDSAGSADLLSLGKHCALEECGQVDFLPFKCSACAETFCLEHRTCKAHRCPKGSSSDDSVIVCPLCAKGFQMRPGEAADAAFERHTRSGCNPANYNAVHNKRKCPVPRCQEKLNTTNIYRCKHCQVEVCLKHRLPADHKCQRQPVRAPPAKPKQQQFPTSPLAKSTKVLTSAFSNLFSRRQRA